MDLDISFIYKCEFCKKEISAMEVCLGWNCEILCHKCLGTESEHYYIIPEENLNNKLTCS